MMNIKELLKIKKITEDAGFINGVLLGMKIKKLSSEDLLSIHGNDNLLEVFCEHLSSEDFKEILRKIDHKDISNYIENNFSRIENLFSRMIKNNKAIDNISLFLDRGIGKYKIEDGDFSFLYNILSKNKEKGEKILGQFTLSDKQKTNLLGLVIKDFNTEAFEMLLKNDCYVYVKGDVVSESYPYINNTESLNENNDVFKVWENLTPEIIENKSKEITKIFQLLVNDLTKDRYFYSLFSESMERTNSKYRNGSKIVLPENLPLEVWKVIYNNLYDDYSKHIISNLFTKIDKEYTRDFIKNQNYLIKNGASRSYLFYLMSGIYLKSNVESIIKENENKDNEIVRNKVKEYVDYFKTVAKDYFSLQDCGYLYYANENKFNINLCKPNSIINYQPLLCNSLSMGVYLDDDELIKQGIRFLKSKAPNVTEQFITVLSFIAKESSFEKIKDFLIPDVEESDSPLYFKNGYLNFFENKSFTSPKEYDYYFHHVLTPLLLKKEDEKLKYINLPGIIENSEEMYKVKEEFNNYIKDKKMSSHKEFINTQIESYITNYEKTLIEKELVQNPETMQKLSKKRL
jgi:hypothetical protein